MYNQQSAKTSQDFSNYETWLAYLWIVNNEYENRVLICARQQKGAQEEQANWLSCQYKESLYAHLNRDNVLGEASLFRDLLQSAFDNIKWSEIIQMG